MPTQNRLSLAKSPLAPIISPSITDQPPHSSHPQTSSEQTLSDVVGRLREFPDYWKTQSRRIRRFATTGVWSKIKKYSLTTNKYSLNNKSHYCSPYEFKLAQTQLKTLIDAKALVLEQHPIILNAYFMVKHRTKWRLVVDLRTVNAFLSESTKVKYEDLTSIAPKIPEGAWMWSIDLTTAYYHVPLSTYLGRHCCILFNGKAYRWTVLPMGLSLSPKIFTVALNLQK